MSSHSSREIKLIGLSGSLRAASWSRIVLQGFAQVSPRGVSFELLDIGAMPFYNEDAERAGPPPVISEARARVASADGVVIVTPEFNHGVPGVLKNALDWLSRPAFNSCLVGKPAMFATQSPGALGGVRAQYQLRETLASMLCRLTPMAEIAVTHVAAKCADGRLTDEATLRHIETCLGLFLADIEAARPHA